MEKRKAKRLLEENKVKITRIHKDELPPDEKIIYGLTKDISSGGARIQGNTFFPIDALLKIELSLKEHLKLISAVGKVRWVQKPYRELFQTGIEFMEMSPGSKNVLKEHLDELEA